MTVTPSTMSTFEAQQVKHRGNRRRVCSTSKAELICSEIAKIHRLRPDRPVHRAQDSLLSWSSGFENYTGVMNWAFLMLTVGGMALIIENLNKYGIRFNSVAVYRTLFATIFGSTGNYSALLLLIHTHVAILITLFNERIIQRTAGENFGQAVHFANLTCLLIVPVVVINWQYDHVGAALGHIICCTNLIAFLKLLSYSQVNYWCRRRASAASSGRPRNHVASPKSSDFDDEKVVMFAFFDDDILDSSDKIVNRYSEWQSTSCDVKIDEFVQSETKMVVYPVNLTLADIYYFWLAPTLCYELNFPRMQRTRKFFLCRRFLEVLIGTTIALGLVQQWMIPSVNNSILPFSNMDLSRAIERLLKLALPNHMIWLVWFYLIFHSALNTVGEVLQFADRRFYSDWWNATNIVQFWQQWNIPVHRWCVRHLYVPLLKFGFTRKSAGIVVFLFSAVFHEYLISVPLGVFKAYAFAGMLFQLPLMSLSSYVERHVHVRAGNVIVWLSLIIGQPMAILMYYHDYIVEHHGPDVVASFARLS